ncbi:MAG: hypothetical protein AAF493_21425 [Pseudomonadota bacterium]
MSHGLCAGVFAASWMGGCDLPDEVGALELDFTFPLSAVVEALGEPVGMDLSPDGEAVAIIDEDRKLVVLSLAGEVILERVLDVPRRIGGLDWVSANSLTMVSRGGRVFHYDMKTDQFERGPRFAYRARSFSMAVSPNGSTYTIGHRWGPVLYRMNARGHVRATRLPAHLRNLRFEGLDWHDGSLYAVAKRSATGRGDLRRRITVVVQLTASGRVIDAWEIEGDARGLAVFETSEAGPTVLTSNADIERTLTLFEPPPEPGDVDLPALELLGQAELGEDDLEQPSGIDYAAGEDALYVVTDFGRVARTDGTGGAVEWLFDVDGSLQGTFEAIVRTNDGVALVQSDADGGGESETAIARFDLAGNAISLTPLTVPGPVEGASVDPDTGALWVIAGAQGQSKQLRRWDTNGSLEVYPLVGEYDELAITGLAVDDDLALMVTAERESDDGGLLAGILIVWDLVNQREIARYAVAVPDESGELEGVIAPSGVALNAEAGIVYVTSDTDAGVVYAFDFDLTE